MLSFQSLSNCERKALYDLKNDTIVVIKSADNGSPVVTSHREDYIKKPEKQLGDKEVYEDLSNNAASLFKT